MEPFEKKRLAYLAEHPLPEAMGVRQTYSRSELVGAARAEAVEITERTISYFLAQGLLSPALPGEASGRGRPQVRFSEQHLAEIVQIKRLQADGFSHEQIKRVLHDPTRGHGAETNYSDLMKSFLALGQTLGEGLEEIALYAPPHDTPGKLDLVAYAGLEGVNQSAVLAAYSFLAPALKRKARILARPLKIYGADAKARVFRAIFDRAFVAELRIAWFRMTGAASPTETRQIAALADPVARLMVVLAYANALDATFGIVSDIERGEG